MYEMHFYKDEKGNEPVLEYIKELAGKRDKDSRIKLNKINDYIQMLSEYGTQAGKPYIKHLEGEIWELRPLRDRIVCRLDKWELYTSTSLYEKYAKNTSKGN